MIRAVLDANVFISGLISRSGAPGQIIDRWLTEEFTLFISPDIIDERKRVLEYPRLKQRISPETTGILLTALSRLAEQTPGTLRLSPLQADPSDTIYLICAVEAGANYLVTGNLAHFQEIEQANTDMQIISPRAFLDLLENSNLENKEDDR